MKKEGRENFEGNQVCNPLLQVEVGLCGKWGDSADIDEAGGSFAARI